MINTNQLFPFLVSGLGFGAVYAMSGTGLLVLYRTTGVLNFAFGAIGAFGASITWSAIENNWAPDWAAYLMCIAFCAQSPSHTGCTSLRVTPTATISTRCSAHSVWR